MVFNDMLTTSILWHLMLVVTTRFLVKVIAELFWKLLRYPLHFFL